MSHLSDTSRLKATVFIGGLDPAVTEQTLLHAFLPFGDIVQVHLPKPDLPTANEPHRGFGYVEFENASDATEAIDNMDRSELYGSVLKVAAAKPQKDASEGLGSKTAIWEQEGWLAEHAVNEEDRQAAATMGVANDPIDPMQGTQGLDEAGPKLA